MPRLSYFTETQLSCHREKRMLFLTVLSKVNTLMEAYKEGALRKNLMYLLKMQF